MDNCGLDCGHPASKCNPEIAASCQGAWCGDVEHLGKETKTSLRAIRRGQEDGEGCSERDSGRHNLENGDQVTMAVARAQI